MKTIRMTLPGSRRMTFYALMIAAVASGISKLFNLDISDDTRALVRSLQELGISIMFDEPGRTAVVSGDKTLFERAEALTHLSGKELAGGEFEMTSLQSKDFVATLFIAAPFAENPVLIKLQDPESYPGIVTLVEVMSDFGVLVKQMHHSRYYIPVPQQYQSRGYTLMPDLSLALYFFASTLLKEIEIILPPMNLNNSRQPEIKFLAVLKKLGCEIVENDIEIIAKGQSTFPGVSVDDREFPDSFMVLAGVAPFATSPTTVTNIKQHAGYINLLKHVLEKLNCKVESGTDWIKIFPSELKAATINCENNLRLAMMVSLIQLRVPAIKIVGADDIKKICSVFEMNA